MTTTLTRDEFIQKAKRIYREVDVPGFGRVGLRQRPETSRMVEFLRYLDRNGNTNPEQAKFRRAHLIIEQVMIDENTPMFSADDIDMIGEMGSENLDQLFAAINQFNEEVDPNAKGESEDTSGN